MIFHPRSSSLLLLVLMALFANAGLGQSLSITKKAENDFWIEAAAPVNTRHVLQASANLQLWVDLQDAVQGQFSYRFDGAGVTTRFFRLTPWTPPPAPIRLVLLGDSTASDCQGWGWGLYGYLKPEVLLINYALPWTSTKVFLRSAELEMMNLVRPDFVLVQLGHMDTVNDVDGGTTLEEYAANLKTIVQTIRGFDGVPILMTIHAARVWDDKGTVIPTWGDRNGVVKAVAGELQTYLLDLNKITTDVYNELGEAGSKFMEPVEAPDWMHFSPGGARVISRLVVNALPDALGPYVIDVPASSGSFVFPDRNRCP